jgi:hypothetical protein
VAGCCEHGDEHGDFIKDRQFIGQLIDSQLRKDCSMELVT